jgi:anti-anti-sigma regulatory factor
MTTETIPLPGEPLSLPADLGVENAAALKALLAARYDDEAAVTVGASAVTRLHAAGLQVLAAFFHGRAANGRATALDSPSAELRAAAARLGLGPLLGLPDA